MASLLLEQQEKLRRLVDEWRFRCHAALSSLHSSDEILPVPSTSSSSSSDPIRLHVSPTELAGGGGLLAGAVAADDNVAVSKFVAVLSHGCLEISRLDDAASRNLYQQLLLFGHHAGGLGEAILEGEPQKVFACSLPLFMELYEVVNAITVVIGNLLRQLDAIYSLCDKNVRPLNSFKSFDFRTVIRSFGQGLAVFLVLDEILRQNGNVRSYLSLFVRTLSKVKSEVNIFGMPLEDVDFLDQVICNLQKLFDTGLFQRLMQAESPLYDSLNLVRCNKKLLDVFSSCFYESMSEIRLRIDSLKELPFDRRNILHLLALYLFFTSASAEAPDKKLGKLLIEMFQLVPVIYIEGGKRIILSDLLKSQCPLALSSFPAIREASEVFGVTKSNYLMRLNEMHSRDFQAINDALSCWTVSFQSAIHPSSQMLTEEWVRLLEKQILQGVVLADRIHMLVLSMLDLHMLLEVPLRREKAKSLCHMIISLKVIRDIFQTKGPSIVRSLPHIINVIQADIEQLILPSKIKLQSEIAKGSQSSKMGFLSSLIRGGTEMDTRLIDSLSLVLMSLQLLEGGGSSQRQLILSITIDILNSLGHLDIDVTRVRKLSSKFRILSDFQSLIDERTNCSFLYWRKEMIGTCLSMVYADACKFPWLQHILDAFSDGLWFLKLGNVGKLTVKCYEEDIENALRNEIVAPLCRDIETDLRLHVHSTHLKGSVSVNPTKTGVRNLSWYLRMKPLRLPFKFVDVKMLVESYLNFAFYSHSVMSTYDRKIYSEMQQLGELKYGVELEEFHLTAYAAEQDFDIRKIVDNLDMFTEKYSYNIIKQMFIENDPDDQGRKSLRVICIEHVASSFAVHGLQLLSAASDSVLKFLNQMFIDLHVLLQNDVDIELLKEFSPSENNIRTLNDQPKLQEGELKFALGKRGLGDHSFAFIEQVHAVVTKIGNVLGLTRILAVACSHYASDISRYARRPTYDMTYSESCKKAGLDDDIVTVGKVLDIAIMNKCQLDNRIRPFSFFISTFSQSNELKQTKDFFRMVPSLIGNMVDCRVLHKDRLLRRDRELNSISHTYDGFLMGVAFVLKVLEQENLFDELNWFAFAKIKLEGASSSSDNHKKMDKKKGGSGTALAGLKIWRSGSSPTTEVHQGLDKSMRFRHEIELIECGLKLARTILS